ncbi:MAG: FkbM family methyltransferase [Candidatus Omnitrophota bacterium]
MFINRMLRKCVKLYPFDKGRYKVMKFAENLLFPCNEVITDLHGKFYFKLELSEKGLQSSFYYFLPNYYEVGTQRYLKEFVKPNMIVIDIGAHMGFYTLLFASLVGQGGKAYSFEPAKRNFIHLKENVAINDIYCVKLFQLALSNKEGIVPLYLHPTENTGHSLINNEKAGLSVEEVQTTTLDNFIEQENIKNIDLIKIDAEGAEYSILKGAGKMLSGDNPPCIICEMPSTKDTGKGNNVREILYSHGYKSYCLEGGYLCELDKKEPIEGLQNILYVKDSPDRKVA